MHSRSGAFFVLHRAYLDKKDKNDLMSAQCSLEILVIPAMAGLQTSTSDFAILSMVSGLPRIE